MNRNRYQHASERDLDIAQPVLSSRPGDEIEAACRCYCFSSSKASTATEDSRVAATDSAEVLQQDLSLSKSSIAGSVVGGDLTSVDIGLEGARIGDEVDESVNVQDSTVIGGDQLTTNLDLASAKIGSTEIGSIQIEDSSPEVLTAALDRVAEFAALSEASRQAATEGLFKFAGQTEANRSEAELATSDKLSTLLDAQASAAQKTDKDTQTNRTVLLAILAVVGLLVWKRS